MQRRSFLAAAMGLPITRLKATSNIVFPTSVLIKPAPITLLISRSSSNPIRLMTLEKVNVLGIELDEWQHESCLAHFATGTDLATLYDIETPEADRRQGLATALLTEARNYYELHGKNVGGTVALNDGMRRIYKRLGIKEYDE